jgi:ABC transporter substrate binding protein
MRRVVFITVLLASIAAAALDRKISAERVIVVCNCSVPAYAEALQGIHDFLGREPDVISPEKLAGGELPASARQDRGGVFIGIGKESFLAAIAIKPSVPMVSVMMLHADVPSGAAASGVDLDVPPQVLIHEIRRLFPQFQRFGLLASPNVDRAAFQVAAKEAEVELVVRDIKSPADLSRILISLKGKADVVLTTPDNVLYNSVTVPALILESLESRIPVIGFSVPFVRAGAAAGVFADYRESGRQAAEAALRLDVLHPQKVIEQPRKVTIALNPRVVRLLGLTFDRNVNVEMLR